MQLWEAEQKAQRQIWLGRTMRVLTPAVATVLSIVSLLKPYYVATSSPGFGLTNPARQALSSFISYAYHDAPIVNVVVKVVWPLVPLLSSNPLLTVENFVFALSLAALMALYAWASVVRDSGLHLSRRVARVKEQAEERQWDRTLTGGVPPDIMAFEIRLEKKDQWHESAMGKVLLGVAITILGGIALILLSRLLPDLNS